MLREPPLKHSLSKLKLETTSEMPLWFYHVGGYYSNVRRNAHNVPMTSDQIADYLLAPKANIKVDDDEGLKFFLGITPCGASYLLVSELVVAANRYLNDLFRGQAWASTSFISLSPISFENAQALSAELSMLNNNKRTKSAQANRDRSQANVAFTTASRDLNELQTAGVNRANFEYHRILYRMCRGTIDPFEYGAERVPWFNDIDTIWSFAYNTWKMDHRTLKERQQDPKVLDISWTEYIPPASSSELYTIKTNYCIVKECKMLKNPARADFLHGQTEEAAHAEISTSLQQIFDERSKPLILVVYDATWALLVLQSFGVDTSSWRLGIEPVLGRPILDLPTWSHSAGQANSRDRGRTNFQSDSYQYDQKQRSARSRSPGKGGQSSFRARSPPKSSKSRYPVYVVDIKNLYTNMRQMTTSDDSISVNGIARDLHLNYDKPEQPAEHTNARAMQQGWCAGNESKLLGYIWSAMASGNAIDEQRLTRCSRIVQKPQEEPEAKPGPAAAASRDAEDSDSDRDPNDIVPSEQGPLTATGVINDPYYSDDDDYLDF